MRVQSPKDSGIGPDFQAYLLPDRKHSKINFYKELSRSVIIGKGTLKNTFFPKAFIWYETFASIEWCMGRLF